MTHSCLCSYNMYVQPIFILVNVSNKQITTSENMRRKLYYRAVALRKDEMSGEKHEEIPKSSDALFENNPKVFELPLFSSTSCQKKQDHWMVSHILRRYTYFQMLKHTISTSCCLEVAVVALFLLPNQEKC